MRTSKPISTISYNTLEFLLERLGELYRNHKICDWLLIQHEPEEDEKKQHIHLWIKPNTLIDTMDLQLFFSEIDPNKPDKPLKCIDFRGSEIDDWILYNMHYEPYLASKGESRKYHYLKEDFFFCDEDSWDDLYLHALKGSDWAKKYQILSVLNDGDISPVDMIRNGLVPLNLASQLNAYQYMATHYGTTTRGGRPNHEPEPEPDEPINY